MIHCNGTKKNKTKIKDKVFIGSNSALVAPLTLEENSIIGAGAVVTKNVPKNCIYAGNPARLVKKINEKEFNTRKDFFSDPAKLAYEFDMLDKFSLKENTLLNWLKSLVNPDKKH